MTRLVSIVSLTAAALLAACATTDGKTDLAAQDRTRAEQAVGPTRAELRAQANLMEPVGRAAFWSQEWERDPTDRVAALEYSRALREIGNAAQAGEVAAFAVEQNPTDIELLLALAAARMGEGRPPAAMGPLETAIEAAPSDWRPYAALGAALDESGRHEEARGRYQQALTLSPDNAEVLNNLGMSYAVSGDLDSAEATLRQAVELPGAGPLTRQNLAMVLAYQGGFDEALQLALVDLPAQAARSNIDYVRSMVTRPRRWEDLRR